MLTTKQVKEIKEHLNKAQNPLFFFDNDPDGLCSFLLLQRFIGRGKGVPVRSFPGLNKEYFRKVFELGADYVFILDKPIVEKDFFEEAEKVNLPVVWIDHHIIEKEKIPSFVNYYNPIFNKPKSDEPVTTLCYQVSNKKDDLWIAVAGSISDGFVPKFYGEFEKKYPELAFKSKKAFDVFYKSQIGKIARIFGFGLKDRTTNVINMIRFLMKVKTPHEVLEENSKNYMMHKRFNQIRSIYQKLLQKAILIGKKQKGLLFFQYGGDLSISADLANELCYLFPDQIIVVVYNKGVKANISMRGKNSRELLLKSIKGLENATGGGHEYAVGGKINIEDIEKFKENLKNLFNKQHRKL
jgi:single-stranded DNA-specific DHH superfamily exonuclease